mmetsp:Transcript_53212/g.147419  ORF Transcript_53212/g.147419 Transcript_53212/m.147419 type:complete len:229 (-) Transcript_53212:1455-2141(-)
MTRAPSCRAASPSAAPAASTKPPRLPSRSAMTLSAIGFGTSTSIETMGSSKATRAESCTALCTASAAAASAAASEHASASNTRARTSTTGMPPGPADSKPRRTPSLRARCCEAAILSMSTPEPRPAGSSSTFAQASTLLAPLCASPLRILVLPSSACCPVARNVSFNVARYCTRGGPNGSLRTLNPSARRSRSSSRCSIPMQVNRVSPVAAHSSTRRPASSSAITSNA